MCDTLNKSGKDRYREICRQYDLPIFMQDFWLDAVCKDSWSAIVIEKSGTFYAAMPFCVKRVYFVLKIIAQPVLTQTLGIYFNYPKNQKYYKKLSFEKKMIEEIVSKLPKFSMFNMSFHYETTNLLPFYWKGFDIGVQYTYVIKKISLQKLSESLETDIRRRRRRKASNIGVSVREGHDIKKLYALVESTFKRQGKKVPYGFDTMERIYQACMKNGCCKIYFAVDPDGDVIAANFLVYDKKSVYYLIGGIDPEKKSLGGMDLIMHESIRFALSHNKTFDFEGSMIEGIEKYFRSFGAIQKPYFTVTKTNSRFLKTKKCLKSLIW